MIFARRSLTANIIITAFERSPDGGKGLARDTRVRWALEEVGKPYDVRLLSFKAMKEPAHLALHPFGQIPTYEEGDLARAPASGRGSRPQPAGPTIRSPWQCRLARWSVQRGRPDDGVGGAQAEIIGHSGRIPEPGRLCRPRRSAARLQAGFRRSIGGLHRQATGRLIEVRPGREVVIRVFRAIY